MRTLIVSEPGTLPPSPEAVPLLVEAFAAWRERWRPKMESFEFFVAGGGWAVLNTTDETELSQCIMEYPFGPYSAVSARPTVNGDEALVRLTQTMKQTMAAMGRATQ